MGLLDRFRRKSLSASPGVVEAVQDRRTNFYVALGGTNNQQISAAFLRGQAATYGWLYANRPAVRAVVDYIARNVAQLPLNLYKRVGDTDRKLVNDIPAALTLQYPDQRTPQDEFIFRLVADWLVYDNAYFLKFRPDAGQQLTLVRLPPAMVTVQGGRFTADFYRIWRIDGSYFDVSPDDLFHWHGYNPEDPLIGVSKLETLRASLTEDSVSQATTVELMKSGLKGGHIERPIEAPEWSPEGRKRFQEDWANQRTASPRTDPVLEEGMKYVQDAISPKDAEMLAGRKFTVEEVCRVYGLPPGALGLEPTTQLDEQRKQVYSDVLPPITQSLACQLDADILRAEYSLKGHYFEFNLNEKLRGDPVQRFQAITAAVGAPWLLRNEARAMENRPAIDGGDDLIVPMNVTEEGENSPALPAPNVMPPQDPNKPPADGSYRETPKALKTAVPGTVPAENRISHLKPRHKAEMARQRRNVSEVQGLLYRFYQRQARAVKSKATFDTARWNAELTKDLHDLLERVVEREGAYQTAHLGGDDFDMRQVEEYLKAMAAGLAEGLNGVTQRDIEALGSRADAIERAMNERAAVAGANIGARATVFARREAAKQAPDSHLRQQTWIADTERHAGLDGATVALGSDWGGIEPGSEPNCACSVSIT